MCQNGGTCYNGKCLCPSGYGGKFCDGLGAFESNSPSLWFILLIILLIIAFMVVFGLCVIRFINQKEKRYNKTSPDNSDGPDGYEDTSFPYDQTDNGEGMEQRNPYNKHHRFVDEE